MFFSHITLWENTVWKNTVWEKRIFLFSTQSRRWTVDSFCITITAFSSRMDHLSQHSQSYAFLCSFAEKTKTDFLIILLLNSRYCNNLAQKQNKFRMENLLQIFFKLAQQSFVLDFISIIGNSGLGDVFLPCVTTDNPIS